MRRHELKQQRLQEREHRSLSKEQQPHHEQEGESKEQLASN